MASQKGKNKTVVKMATAMLSEKNLAKSFWAGAIHIVVYILNRCPTKAVKNMTPFEAWSETKPSVKHFKVFGSICYMVIFLLKNQD